MLLLVGCLGGCFGLGVEGMLVVGERVDVELWFVHGTVLVAVEERG